MDTAAGVRPDGIIAVDPIALAYILGDKHIRVPLYRTPITGANLVRAVEHDQYGLSREAQQQFPNALIGAAWKIPGKASPDMGGVSADGKILWLTGRYDAEVYALSTDDGHLIARIKVGKGPHGLCVWPQPGRYSVGHTGIMR